MRQTIRLSFAAALLLGLLFISSSAFALTVDPASVTGLSLPEGTTEITRDMLSEYPNLESLTIPASVTQITYDALWECDHLKQLVISNDHPVYAFHDDVLIHKPTKTLVTYLPQETVNHFDIPDGIAVIGEYAFSGADFVSIGIPESIISIGECAFSCCDNLKTIDLPDGLKSIDSCAFEFCQSLESIILPNGLESLGGGVFDACLSLKNINVPGSVKTLYSLGDNSWYFYPDTITLGYGIESLKGTFYRLSLDNVVYLPDSITHIGTHTFFLSSFFCPSLPANLTQLEEYALEQGSFGDIVLPENLEYEETSFFMSSIRSLTVPGSYKEIGGFRCTHLGYVYLCDGVEVIRDHAFSGNENLTTVRLPSTLRVIGDYAFSYDDSSYARIYSGGLKTLDVPEGTQRIGEGAFMGSKLEHITLPSSLTEIGPNAFANCPEDLVLVVPAGSYAEQYAKDNHLTYYSIPSAVQPETTAQTVSSVAVQETNQPQIYPWGPILSQKDLTTNINNALHQMNYNTNPSSIAQPGFDVTVQETSQPDLYAEVREIPQNDMDAILMIDTSGSMSWISASSGKNTLTYAKEAANAFTDQAFGWNQNYRIGLGTFDSSARAVLSPAGPQQISDVRAAIAGMHAGGQTDIAGALDEAAAMLESGSRPNARQLIVLLTDGIHNCSGDPVSSGEKAMKSSDGIEREIYTVGLVGALSEQEKEYVRDLLDRDYAVRYIEIDDQQQIEGIFYMLAAASATGDEDERIHMLRVRGAAHVEVVHVPTGETLSSDGSGSASFGSVYMTQDQYEALYILSEGEYTLRVTGGDVRTIGIVMETLNGKAENVATGADLRFNGNAGTRLEASLSFTNHRFDLRDLSFDPYTYEGPDPFSGSHYAPKYVLKVPTGIANLPNGGLVTQRTGGYSASVPNEANMPNRVHEQHLEIFNEFFESEGFIVQERTSYDTNYDGYTYFLGGGDMKLYRVPEDGGSKTKLVDKALRAYWVDETGIYFGDGTSIIRRAHGETKGKTVARHGVASGSNLSRMIRFENLLYFISAKDRCIYSVPYEGGDPVKLTSEAARCFTFAQLGNDVVLIYNTYDKNRDAEYLRAIDLSGNRIHALDDLRTINTHYFNYAHGYLYYCKKNEGCALYRINLNNLSQNEQLADICASRIYLFDNYVVTTDDSKYYCIMRPDGSEFKTIYAPYATD